MRRRLCALVLLALALGACRAADPPTRPEEVCQHACADRAAQCSEHECTRGCAFILDRLIERETNRVVGCVGKQKTCDDPVWANCAVLVGAHADGGPPAPPPPAD
jgi:hypothetical protein